LSSPPTWQRGQLLVTLVLALCSGMTLPACGAASAHRSAAQLGLDIWIADQYASDNRVPVDFTAQLYDPSSMDEVVPPAGAHFSCNGLPLTHCPRQPPGGAYAPLAPRPNALATLPADGLLTVRLGTPRLPGDGILTIDRLSLVCGSPATATYRGVVSLAPQEQATPPARSAASPMQGTGPWMAAVPQGLAPTSPATPTPLSTRTPCSYPSSSHATISHGEREADIRVSTDSSYWQPGPAEIDLSVRALTHPAPNGFVSASATFADHLTYAITWVR
jgi:hypothetical protein